MYLVFVVLHFLPEDIVSTVSRVVLTTMVVHMTAYVIVLIITTFLHDISLLVYWRTWTEKGDDDVQILQVRLASERMPTMMLITMARATKCHGVSSTLGYRRVFFARSYSLNSVLVKMSLSRCLARSGIQHSTAVSDTPGNSVSAYR